MENCNSEICRLLGSVRTDHIRRYVLAKYDVRILSLGDTRYTALQHLPLLRTDDYGRSGSDRWAETVLTCGPGYAD